MSKNSVAFEETKDKNYMYIFVQEKLCVQCQDVVEGQPRKEILLRILT